MHSLYIFVSQIGEIPREEAEKSEEGREKLGEFHEFLARNASRGKAGGESRPVAVLHEANCIHLYFRFEPVASHHAGNILQGDNIIIKESVFVKSTKMKKSSLESSVAFSNVRCLRAVETFREIWEIRANVSFEEEGFKPSPKRTYPTLSFHQRLFLEFI